MFGLRCLRAWRLRRTWPLELHRPAGAGVVRTAVRVETTVVGLDVTDPREDLPLQPEALTRLLVEDEIRRRDPLIDAGAGPPVFGGDRTGARGGSRPRRTG